MELFVLTDNLVFNSLLYNGASNILLLLEIIIRLHQVQMRGYFILRVVHIAGNTIIKAGIDVLLKVNNLGVIMRGFNPIQFVPIYQGVVERSTGVESWIRSWWVNILIRDWFDQNDNNLIWAPPSSVSDMALDLLL